MSDSLHLLIRADGQIICLYDESIELSALGEMAIRRASHVEPLHGEPGRWSADLSPVGGPRLGPFTSRTLALAAERAWILDHWFTEKGAMFDVQRPAVGHRDRRAADPVVPGVPGPAPLRPPAGIPAGGGIDAVQGVE